MNPTELSGLAEVFFERFQELGPAFHVPFIALFAGMLGSFINVCIWRIPRGQSIVLPRSRCTSCGTALGVPDLVPVLSWLATRGHCRHCKAPVSSRYVLVELVVIGFWLTGYALFGLGARMALLGVSLSVIFCAGGIRKMSRQIRLADRGGFTFLTVMLAALLLGIVIGPFLDATRTNYQGVQKNREYLIGYKLAQEKLEELLAIPARQLLPDRKIYVETARLSDNIYADEFFGDYSKMRENKDYFYEKFSDVYTAENRPPETIFSRFRRNFKTYQGFEYELYPQGYEIFRRVTRVQDVAGKPDSENFLKRIIVVVEINSRVTRSKIIQLEVLTSQN